MESPVSASRMAPRSKSATSFREAQEHDASATSSSTTPRRDPAGTSWQETEPQSTAPAPKHPHMLSSIDRGSFKGAPRKEEHSRAGPRPHPKTPRERSERRPEKNKAGREGKGGGGGGEAARGSGEPPGRAASGRVASGVLCAARGFIRFPQGRCWVSSRSCGTRAPPRRTPKHAQRAEGTADKEERESHAHRDRDYQVVERHQVRFGARARASAPPLLPHPQRARHVPLIPSSPPLPPSVRPTTGAGGFARPRLASPAGSTSRW